MSQNDKLQNWTLFLELYCKQNAGRPTRLGVFKDNNDFWLEDGLELQGIVLDSRSPTPTIEIMLDGYTHIIEDVSEMKANFSRAGNGNGLDFTDGKGTTTILRFENW